MVLNIFSFHTNAAPAILAEKSFAVHTVDIPWACHLFEHSIQIRPSGLDYGEPMEACKRAWSAQVHLFVWSGFLWYDQDKPILLQLSEL